jgi:hypothetical protein
MRLRFLLLPAVLLAGGCALPTSPVPSPGPQAEAAEQARREERLRILQEYWYDHTLSPGGDAAPAPGAPLLEYPAGVYSGIRYVARLAADPSLAEPDR